MSDTQHQTNPQLESKAICDTIAIKAQQAALGLFPKASKETYDRHFVLFQRWCKDNNLCDDSYTSSTTHLAFFNDLKLGHNPTKTQYNPASIWTISSCVKKNLIIYHRFKEFSPQVTAWLKVRVLINDFQLSLCSYSS